MHVMRGLIGAMVTALGVAAGVAAAEATKPLEVLYVTGGCCHDYEGQKQAIVEGLKARANVNVTVVHEGGASTDHKVSIYAKPEWAKGYDVVFHNECFANVKDPEFVKGLLAEHARGVPAVLMHCAMHCYRTGTDDWFEFCGIKSPGHGAHYDYTANLVAEHPIVNGLPKEWKLPKEELYFCDKLFPTAKPLAEALSRERKSNQTVIWTNDYRGTRVFGTTIGHYTETVKLPEFLDLLSRGTLWAAGKLQDDGKPAAGYAAVAARIALPAVTALAQVQAAAPATTPAVPAAPATPAVPAAAPAAAQPAAAATGADWAAGVALPDAEKAKAVKLFNGKDFEGWEGHVDPYWSIENGEIVGKNSAENAPKVSTYLLTTKPYRNFRLLVEGKLVTSEMHSGVAIWGKKFEKDGEASSYQGHLVMFPSGWGLYDLFRRNGLSGDQQGRARRFGKQHDWNKMEILAIGSRIRLAVNGQEVLDWSDPKPEFCQDGPIGLQLHSNKVPQEVRFRGLVLVPDPTPNLITIPAAK